MSRLHLFVALLIVGLFGLGLAYLGNDSGTELDSNFSTASSEPAQTLFVEGAPEPSADPVTLAPEKAEIGNEPVEVATLRRDLEQATRQLERISRPLNEHILSSQVNAEIYEGESLVTGGYQKADGNYELTFLTPRSLMLEDERQAIEVESQIVSINSDFVYANGLESLATNARNTLQHAEAWRVEDVAETLGNVPADIRRDQVFEQRSVILPSEPFTLTMGDPSGLYYTLNATVDISDTGSYLIQSRIERTGE